MMFILLLMAEAVLSTKLKATLENANDTSKIYVIIHLKQNYPFDTVENLTPEQKAKVFKEIASNSQRELIRYLENYPDEVEEIKQFWVFNGLHLKATKRLLNEILKRDEIAYILPNDTIFLSECMIHNAPLTTEWNISKVMADSCWYAGYDGTGILIGHLNTGCDFNHPALQNKWSGKWRDCVNGYPAPYDDQGFGTYITGILCGGDGLEPFTEDIGVAPGAKTILAKCFDSQGAGQYAWIDNAMQWMADLKADSGIDLKVVCNPWGSTTQLELHWWYICNVWKSLEIFGVFAAGSSGPGVQTVGTPGNYPTVMAIGATDNADYIANFSSRGPAPNISPWKDSIYWYRSDWNLTKPDICAPGVSIRSSYLSNQYITMSGTTSASAHVAGACAILCHANMDLQPEELFNLLADFADRPSHGAPYPNNNYGWGRLNIWHSLGMLVNIKENEKRDISNQICIFPNPTSGIIELYVPLCEYIINIYNISGTLVMTRKITNPREKIMFPQTLSNGIYFLDIKTPQYIYNKKILLIR